MARYLQFKQKINVPLLTRTDLLVIGGSLSGLAAAREYAAGGKKVMVVEAGTFLGYEMTSCLRPWLRWKEDYGSILREWFPVVDREKAYEEGEIIPLLMHSLKCRLEDILIDGGVDILYASRPVSLSKHNGGWLAVIGNKSGRQAVICRQLLDTTEEGVAGLLKNRDASRLKPGAGAARKSISLHRTFEFTGVKAGCASMYAISGQEDLAGIQAGVFPGAHSAGHVFIDVPIVAETTVDRYYTEDIRIENMARKKCLQVAGYLVNEVPAFSEALLGSCACRTLRSPDFDPLAAVLEGAGLGKEMLRKTEVDCYILAERKGYTSAVSNGEAENLSTGYEPMDRFQYREENDFVKVRKPETILIKQEALGVLAETEVAVAGGGTSGAVAAVASGRRKVKTALLEMNDILGGAGTAGGVNMNWMCTPNRYSEEIERRVVKAQEGIKYPEVWLDYQRTLPSGIRYTWEKEFCWSMEVKAQVLLDMCLEEGVEVYFNCLTIGTLMQGNKAAGVVLATPYGPCAIVAEVTVDATGDGDVAAFAGAGYVYGSDRDRFTMWTALSPFSKPACYKGNFYTPADIDDILDYTRFIITSRRRPENVYVYDHARYVTPRESRHIAGDIMITLKDELLMRRYKDTVSVAFSNYDLKGKSMADVVTLGICPPNLDIEIPYRALLPKGIDNLIVTGRCFSVSHDALAAPRMQRDMQQLGGAAGLAAAYAVIRGVTPRELPIREVQEQLAAEGNLAARVLENRTDQYGENEDLEMIIRSLTGEEEFDWLLMHSTDRALAVPPVVSVYYADPGQALPLLSEEYKKSAGRKRLMLARMLAWHGSDEGLDVILNGIKEAFDEEYPLPGRRGDTYFAGTSPNQETVPEVIFLLNTLMRPGSRKVVPVFGELVERIHKADRDYLEIRAGIFDYIECVAYVAERLAFKEFIPVLKRLLELPEFEGRVLKCGMETDFIKERQAYLLLYIYRAMARCGSKCGLNGLAGLTGDLRAMVAKNAQTEIKTITGLDFGLDEQKWKAALEQWPDEFAPVPWTRRID